MDVAERRGLLDRIFGRRPAEDQKTIRLEVISTSGGSMFGEWRGDPYAAEIVRSSIDAIARNAAKLKPRHVRRSEGKILPGGGSLERLLAVRPNPHMSAYDMLYKVVTTLLVENTAWLFPQVEGDQVVALWPVSCQRAEFLSDGSGQVYVRFTMRDGQFKTFPYAEVLHLRRHFFRSELGCEDNSPLGTSLKVISVTNTGLATAVESSAKLRGLLKFSSILKPEDLKKQRDEFVRDYLAASNDGGVAALDNKAEYVPLEADPKLINAPQMQELRNNIYRYFGVNESIVTSKYTEDEWNAFYESVIEPLAVQLSLEFTAKLFTDRERGHGNEIVFEANRLQYASVKTKLDLREMVDRGALTPNEWREAFNLGPIPGGDKPLRRLDTGVVHPTGATGGAGSQNDDGGDADGGDSEAGSAPGGTEGS